MAAKKATKQKPILLRALKRAIPVIKDDDGRAYIRFSLSETGNLMLTGKGSGNAVEEEIPEASALRPGGPGLMTGDFGIVNFSSEPFDFVLDATQLLPALKQGKTDPLILFYGLNKIIEFTWPNYKFLTMRSVLDAVN